MSCHLDSERKVRCASFRCHLEKAGGDFWEAFQVSDSPRIRKKATQGRVSHIHHKQYPFVLCVYKESNDPFYTVYHEYQVYARLKSLANQCPHFLQCFGVQTYPASKNIDQAVLLLEDLSYCASPLGTFLRAHFSESRIHVSLLKQILAAIRLAREWTNEAFTHYDLHEQNVLVTPCPERVRCIQYKFQDGSQWNVDIYGYYIVIIDFGHSFVGSSHVRYRSSDSALTANMAITDKGYLADRPDDLADIIRLYHSLSNPKLSHDSLPTYLGKLVRNEHWISKGRGWDTYSKIEETCVEAFHNTLCEDDGEKTMSSLHLLKRGTPDFILSLQCIVSLPLESLDIEYPLNEVLIIFSEEWKKIEERITSSITLHRIFRGFCRAVRLFRGDLLQAEWRSALYKRIVCSFEDYCRKEIEKHVQYFQPSTELDFEVLFHSIVLMSAHLENVYALLLQERVEEREGRDKAILAQMSQHLGAPLHHPREALKACMKDLDKQFPSRHKPSLVVHPRRLALLNK